MTPNNFDDFNDRHHDFEDVPEDDNLPGAAPTENDHAASGESTLLDDWGGPSDALGG